MTESHCRGLKLIQALSAFFSGVAGIVLIPNPAAAQLRVPDPPPRDEIVVTGERAQSVYTGADTVSFGPVSLTLQEVPQSLQVLTRDLIDDQGVLSLAELFNNVAGASNSLGRSTPFGTASTQIRGQDVVIYRDGLRDVDFSDIDSSALNNVDRVEVLKGSAGLIFGTGGPGGFVNIITKRPTERFYAEAKVTLGGRDTKIFAGDVSVPLGSGLGIRVTGEVERSDSFIRFSEIERDNFGAVLAYYGGRLRATARYENHSNRDDRAMTRVGLPTIGTITRLDVVRIDRGTYLGEPSFDFTKSFGSQTSLFLGYDVSDALSIEAAGRRATVNFEQADVRTISALNLTSLRVTRTRGRVLDLNSTQYDGRVVGKLKLPGASGDNEFAVGYEFFRQELGFVNRNLPNAAIPMISVVSPTYLAGGLQERLGPNVPFEQLSDSHEAFAQGVVRVGHLTATGAIRQIWSEFDRRSKLDNTVFQLGAAYAFADQISVFAGANSGFNANADIAADRNRLGVRFSPEKYRQYEAGIKTSFLSGVTGTVSVFRLTRDNILVTDPIDASFLIQAGKERSQGGEVDFNWEVSRAFVLRGGYAYLDAEIVENTDPTQVGLEKPNAPRHQFNLYGAYTVRSGFLNNLRVSAGIVHSGKTFAAITNTIERPAYTIANFTASYRINRYRFDAILSNAFDERYFLARNNATVSAGEPLQLLFRASARF